MLKPRQLYIILLFLFQTNIVVGENLDTIKYDPASERLFEQEAPIRLTLALDVKKIRNDNSDDPEYSEAILTWHQENGEDVIFNIKAKARGYARRVFDFCTFPPVKINFKKKDVKNTVFQGQDKLKLVTYCKDVDVNEDYVLQEYLIYKVYNTLTPYSFKVRLAEITYKDLNDKSRDVTRYGFLIEDDDIMALRNGGKISEALMSNHDRCDRKSIDTFTIFQFMIGNCDWWLAKPKIHNAKLIFIDGKAIIPVPYDFDYCGAINTSYAVPPETLPISSVRERYFRGYCRLPGTYETTVNLFNEKKEYIYDIYNNFELLDEKRKKSVLKYYDNFYELVNDSKQLEKKVYNYCELHHTHLHKSKKRK